MKRRIQVATRGSCEAEWARVHGARNGKLNGVWPSRRFPRNSCPTTGLGDRAAARIPHSACRKSYRPLTLTPKSAASVARIPKNFARLDLRKQAPAGVSRRRRTFATHLVGTTCVTSNPPADTSVLQSPPRRPTRRGRRAGRRRPRASRPHLLMCQELTTSLLHRIPGV